MVNKKGSGGRPKKQLTEAQIEQVEALAAVLSKAQIADYFGMSQTTFIEIEKRQPEVSERYKKGRAKAIDSVAQGLLQQAREGNMAAAIFFLKTQAGWRETQVVDNVSSDGSMTPTTITRIVIDPKQNELEH